MYTPNYSLTVANVKDLNRAISSLLESNNEMLTALKNDASALPWAIQRMEAIKAVYSNGEMYEYE